MGRSVILHIKWLNVGDLARVSSFLIQKLDLALLVGKLLTLSGDDGIKGLKRIFHKGKLAL